MVRAGTRRRFAVKTWFILYTGRLSPCRRGGRLLPRGRGYFYVLVGRKKMVVDFEPFRGMCVRWIGPRDHVFHFTETALGRHYERPSMKRKGVPAEATMANHLAAVESNYFSQLMALVEHCAVTKYDDGESRLPGWFTVKTQGSAWVVQVKDPDSCCSATFVGETLDKALETAVLLLGCDSAPWEADSFLAQAKARRKK